MWISIPPHAVRDDKHTDTHAHRRQRHEVGHAEAERDALVHPNELDQKSQGASGYQVAAQDDRIAYGKPSPSQQRPP